VTKRDFEFSVEGQGLLVDALANDDAVWALAYDILTGEIEPARYPMFVTDQLDWQKRCKEIQDEHQVDQAVVEQAIEHAKKKLLSEGLYD
jgi:hypothetical protein